MAVDPRDIPWSNGKMPFQLMNIVPNPKRPQDRWSDAPGFQGARMVPGPEHLNRAGQLVATEQFEMLLDPEKHIERTSSYEGSTDRRDPFSGDVQSAADTWIDKKKEAALPGDAVWKGGPNAGLPVHGAGWLDKLRAGGRVEDPARLIIQPSRFPRAGNQPMQHEGHHRVAGSAMRQKELRESGAEDWSVPVPYQLHFSVEESNKAEDAVNDRRKRQRHAEDHPAR